MTVLAWHRAEFERLLEAKTTLPHAILIRGDIGRENFQCNSAIEFRVFGQIYFTHPSGTDFLQDAVV